MRAEIDDLMPRLAEMSHQFFFQTKPTMIRGNSHAHVILLTCIQPLAVLLPRGRPAAEPARGPPARRESTHRHRGGDGALLPFRSRSQPTGSGGPDSASDTSMSSGACLDRG